MTRLRAREVHDPVRLPGLAAVLGERLLPARGRRRDSGPDEAHADRPALERVVSLEHAGVAVEAAEHRRVELARAARVRPVDRPPLLLRVEEAEGHAGEAAGVVRPELVLVPEAVEDRSRDDRRLELVPLVRAREPLAEPAVLHLPGAHPEVEVARRSPWSRLRSSSRCLPVVDSFDASEQIGRFMPSICARLGACSLRPPACSRCSSCSRRSRSRPGGRSRTGSRSTRARCGATSSGSRSSASPSRGSAASAAATASVPATGSRR